MRCEKGDFTVSLGRMASGLYPGSNWSASAQYAALREETFDVGLCHASLPAERSPSVSLR